MKITIEIREACKIFIDFRNIRTKQIIHRFQKNAIIMSQSIQTSVKDSQWYIILRSMNGKTS